ncbi:MAG: bifunctional 4-hydroxy-2-oxoglutarate aldolase/2-dehydro-3-deoxy-phosphogluconate aldolase [Clostridiales bacterium]|nr:bifunctional 4-hydroxy-2-oxoglutarate aldolase/2-dehydro-3-deoxy-phosphogluconate aldolase [Clostridiales bacterium]
MNEILKKVGLYGIVPVVKIDDVEKAVPLAKALCEGGLPVAEITFRTACAEEAIKRITAEFPNMLVGAGTVLTPEQADKAVAAGAKFIVSPGLNPKVVKHCIDIGVPITPGCSNPSDIEAALELGLDVVKFFPAEAAGGLAMIKAMSAPYGGLKFMPTGGLNESNILSYLKFNKILACGGSYMVSSDLINAGEFDKIAELTRAAVMQMHGFELRHVGFNCESKEKALAAMNLICSLFGLEPKPGNSGAFAGKEFEFMYTPFHGKNGHIAIAVNFLDRAVFYFQNMGIEFEPESYEKFARGESKAVYFKDDIAGFAFHLLQK